MKRNQIHTYLLVFRHGHLLGIVNAMLKCLTDILEWKEPHTHSSLFPVCTDFHHIHNCGVLINTTFDPTPLLKNFQLVFIFKPKARHCMILSALSPNFAFTHSLLYSFPLWCLLLQMLINLILPDFPPGFQSFYLTCFSIMQLWQYSPNAKCIKSLLLLVLLLSYAAYLKTGFPQAFSSDSGLRSILDSNT